MKNDKNTEKLRIAIMGTRGIPARYGGFETFAEELSTRLVEMGHEVSVYCRRGIAESDEGPEVYRGVRREVTITLRQKYLETPLHALSSFLHLFWLRLKGRPAFDVVLLCNAANSPFAFLVRALGYRLFINVDGIERLRSKWNRLGRLWYGLGEYCSVLFANRIVADAQVIAKYYREVWKVEPAVITYGAKEVPRPASEMHKRFGLTPGKYLLYVSRLEPENNALGVIEAYNQITTEMPLVVVGDAPYASEYIKTLKERAGKNVIFTGFQFAEAYQEFRSNCYLYVQASEVGGTHPALIEAMVWGNCVVANDVPEHREVLEDCGMFYPKNDFSSLSLLLQRLVSEPETVRILGLKAKARAEEFYNWNLITKQYLDLFGEKTS